MRRTRGPNATKRTRAGFCAINISRRHGGRRGFGNDISASLRLHAPGRVTESSGATRIPEFGNALPNQGAMFSVPDEVRRPENVTETVSAGGQNPGFWRSLWSELGWKYSESADGIQMVLDGAGFVLPPADLLNGGISAIRGDWAGAGVNVVAIIPVVGDGIKGGKMAAEALEQGVKHADEVKGGVYVLKDGDDVMRSGRTNDFKRRAAEHKRKPELEGYQFETKHKTNDYHTQRGLEQKVHDEFKPPLDKIEPISPHNPRKPEYIKAAEDFLNQ